VYLTWSNLREKINKQQDNTSSFGTVNESNMKGKTAELESRVMSNN
jgi:hypothetical protein